MPPPSSAMPASASPSSGRRCLRMTRGLSASGLAWPCAVADYWHWAEARPGWRASPGRALPEETKSGGGAVFRGVSAGWLRILVWAHSVAVRCGGSLRKLRARPYLRTGYASPSSWLSYRILTVFLARLRQQDNHAASSLRCGATRGCPAVSTRGLRCDNSISPRRHDSLDPQHGIFF